MRSFASVLQRVRWAEAASQVAPISTTSGWSVRCSGELAGQRQCWISR